LGIFRWLGQQVDRSVQDLAQPPVESQKPEEPNVCGWIQIDGEIDVTPVLGIASGN